MTHAARPVAERSAPLSLAPGESLVAWEMSAITTRPFPGVPAPASDPLNYHFINGFVDVGDLPCRVATHEEIRTRTVALQTDWPVESLFLPGTSRRVEFPCFHNTPTRLARWLRTRLLAPRDGDYPFALSTAGGVHVWVDGALAAKFEPFLRNGSETTQITLPLKAAGSDVVVLTEDMAERDTNWFFELRLGGAETLGVALAGLEADGPTATLESLAREVRPDGEFVGGSGDFALLCDTAPDADTTITVAAISTSHAKTVFLERELVWPKGATRLVVGPASALPQGYLTIKLVFALGAARIDRAIAVPVLHDIAPRTDTRPLAIRKAEALAHLAVAGEERMGTALAMLASGRVDADRFRAITERTLAFIEERADCSDFVLVPLLWAYRRYRDAFPADLAERTKVAALNYRYWIDEPGNDVMWFWSENHVLCFHACQLMAGEMFPDDLFTASGRTGAEQHALAVARLERWFDAVEAEGLAEWNSAAYYPVDLIGLLALVEFAPPALADRARRVTDRVFTMVALHTLNGIPAGTMGRAYDKELRAGPPAELAPFVALAFGTGWFSRGVASVPQFAAGGYVPPEGLTAYVAPEPGTALVADYVQGFDRAARLHLFKTDAVQLSSNSAARPGRFGHQQHVVDLLFAGHPFARAWINHPGEDDPWGRNRPSYWAGNGTLPRVAQDGNIAMLVYDLGDDPRIGFTHAYVSAAGIAVERVGDWLMLQSGRGLAAIGATAPLEAVTRGPGAGREYRAQGRHCGWAVIAAATSDADAFRAELAALHLELSADGHRLTLAGGRAERALDWTEGLFRDGVPVRDTLDSVEPVVTRWRG